MEKKRRISESPVEDPTKGKKIQLKDLRICIDRLKQYPLRRKRQRSPEENPAAGEKIKLKDLRICIERLKQYPLRSKRLKGPEENPAAEEKITTKEIETNKQIDRDVDRKQYPLRRKRPRSPEQSPEQSPAGGKEKVREDAKTSEYLDIENYSLIKELGQGNFGKVVLASFKIKNQLTAIKIIEKQREEDFEYVRREASVLQIASRSPFLCRAMATFQTKSLILLALEYVNGGTLENIIEDRGRLSNKQVLFYASELVVGIQFLHENGIVHRDLKPENILVDEQGHVKIGDFGLVCTGMYGVNTRCGYYGTPGYTAPQVLLEEPYDAGADWWSFGVILYEMATNRLPFSPKGNLRQQVESVINREPEYPDSLSTKLRDLIKQLLKKKANQRLGVNGNIRDHPFFSTVDWSNVEKRTLKPPIKPSHESATGFNRKYISFPKEDPSETRMLEGFDYVDPSWLE
ncbi:protein kinase C delta type-like isoform X1 [Xenopus laevis]|uniref:Protein kinase C delta type-like isoform X1 n=1 Tax=Xenopus laevis TaxID=8355 RepID=A0A8J1L1J1_XENLA|nr:protein kinase C delta type-like isoform X1 [Xenopus laevis]